MESWCRQQPHWNGPPQHRDHCAIQFLPGSRRRRGLLPGLVAGRRPQRPLHQRRSFEEMWRVGCLGLLVLAVAGPHSVAGQNDGCSGHCQCNVGVNDGHCEAEIGSCHHRCTDCTLMVQHNQPDRLPVGDSCPNCPPPPPTSKSNHRAADASADDVADPIPNTSAANHPIADSDSHVIAANHSSSRHLGARFRKSNPRGGALPWTPSQSRMPQPCHPPPWCLPP